ncbi:MAG: CvpA family protein [Candidatus Obscuribacterales bacterium]|nr:CvpA family protein [Candidatus Obscuribacterales bacterium]
MFWDLLLPAVLITFALTGWATGLSKKWYAVPVSVVIATVLCQHLYIDAATFLAEILHLEPFLSVLLAYLILWICVQQFIESILTHYRAGPIKGLELVDKVTGSIVAFSKCLLGFVCAAMVAYSHSSTVPNPPVLDWQDRWLAGAVRSSKVLGLFHQLAEASHPVLGKYVLSDAAPRFRPNFNILADPFEDIENQEREHGKDVYRKYKDFKKTEEEASEAVKGL